jgi:propionyl-CoA carboxylase beta chain
MAEAISRLKEIKEKNIIGGGERHIERQHKRGKMLARERIDCLLDPGSFNELGSCVTTTCARIDGRVPDAPCDGAVVGTGKVDGRLIAVYASDFTILGGSTGIQHLLKCAKLILMAADWKIPMVWLLDSSGGRLGYTDVPIAGIDWYFGIESRISGMIPQINVLMGPCIAGAAYAPTLCDFLLMSRKSANLWLGGPRMTQAATSEKIGKDVGGADYHMAYTGTCDVVGNDDEKTIKATRNLLSYLPSNYMEKPPSKVCGDDPCRSVNKIVDIVPDDYGLSYDMHDIIELIVDDGDYFEIKDEYAKNIITCFCRFNGEVAGIVACNPKEGGSVIEINSCDKYYKFLQTLDAYSIPLINLVDTPCNLPDEKQEKEGLLRHLCKLTDVYATSSIPKISVVIRESYADAGGLAMGGLRGMGADICYAWPLARYAVEASNLDYSKIYNMGIEEGANEQYLNQAKEKIDAFETAESWTSQVLDEIIEPKDTRKMIINALELTKNKRVLFPERAKIHGTCPT